MKTSIIAATLLTASMTSGVANAQESVLQSLLTNMVSNAVAVTTQELQADVYQAVASTSYHFELSADEVKSSGKVSVTELVRASEQSDEDQSESVE